MTILAEQLQAILQQQQEQFEEAQLKLIEHLKHKMSVNTTSTGMLQTSSTDTAENSISEFYFDPECG